MTIEIRNHRIYVGGRAVPFKRTPNIGGKLKPQGIIVHDTAGDLAGTGSISWLCDRRAKASAHVVIDRLGNITQLAPLNVATWHAGASSWQGRRLCNGFTIGIEIVNPGALVKHGDGFSNNADKPQKGVKVAASLGVRHHPKTKGHGAGHWLDYTPEQIGAVTGLCHAIRDAYGVTFIAPHWEISPGRKVDTNPLFPLDELRAAVFSHGMPTHFLSAPGDGEIEDMSAGAISAPKTSMIKSVEGAAHGTTATIGAGGMFGEIGDASAMVDQAIDARHKAASLGLDVSPITIADYVLPFVSKLASSPVFWIFAGMAVIGVVGWLRRRARMRREAEWHRLACHDGSCE